MSQPCPANLVQRLSPREAQVLTLVANGLTSREIATGLGTMPETVRGQRKDAIRKIGARNSAHAIAILLGRAA